MPARIGIEQRFYARALHETSNVIKKSPKTPLAVMVFVAAVIAVGTGVLI